MPLIFPFLPVSIIISSPVYRFISYAIQSNTALHFDALDYTLNIFFHIYCDFLILIFKVSLRFCNVGSIWIEEEELRMSRYAQSVLTTDPRIILLCRTNGWLPSDGAETHNLPIFSFLIRRGHRFLHYNFVCALLNDLFGVQSRGKSCLTNAQNLLFLHTTYCSTYLIWLLPILLVITVSYFH